MLIPGNAAVERPQQYLDRQAFLASRSTGVGHRPHRIEYSNEENATWRTVRELLVPLWDRYAAMPLRSAQQALDLPTDHIPQLSLVSRRLQGLTGFQYAAVPGTVSGDDFFAALSQRIFPSTQFIRWSGSPLYTPEPDVLHEVGGHAVSLANPRLAELHRLAGLAAGAAPALLTPIAAVFWYSVEFGVVASRDGWKAYGAGLLSSPGELGWFGAHADVRPLDIATMISTPYDINHYQPVLFGADSLDHVFEVVGSFYTDIITQVGEGHTIESHNLTPERK